MRSSPATARIPLRLYLMFLGPLEAMKPWNPQRHRGPRIASLQKVWRECIGEDGAPHPKIAEHAAEPDELGRLLHETIRKVGDDIAALRFNTAISSMMILANALQKAADGRGPRRSWSFLQLLGPFRAAPRRGIVGAPRRPIPRSSAPPGPAIRSRPPPRQNPGQARFPGQRQASGATQMAPLVNLPDPTAPSPWPELIPAWRP